MPARRASRFAILSLLLSVAPALADAQIQPACANCTFPHVTVTPWGTEAAKPLNSSPDTVIFTVSDDGNSTESFAFTCSSTGGIACLSVSPASKLLAPGDSVKVKAIYSVGATVGNVQLTATGDVSGAFNTGWYVVSANPNITVVAPVLTSGSRAVVRNRQPLVRALFTTNGSPMDSTKTVLKWRTDTVTTLARANRGLVEWEPDSARWITVGDSGQILVTACAQNGLCTTATRWAVLANDSTPVLGFSGMPLEALGRRFTAPFGPGISVSGAEVETGFASPPYVSMGAGRSAGLVYSTRQSYPRALVPVDLELPWPAGTPDQVKLTLFDGATKLDSLVLSAPTCATGAVHRCRAVLQGDFSASSFAVPTRKGLTVEARVTVGSTTKIGTDSVEVVLVDRRTTLYGAGWWPAGALKLVAAGSDRVLVGPTGTAGIYRGNGDSLYVAPPGDFTVLTKTGSGWQLSPRGSAATLVFDATGRLIKSVDQNGNRDSIAYSGASDQVTTLVDPVGKTITFAYDANGKLSTFTDPGSRQTKVAINATTNQLTYDSLSSLSTRPYTTAYVYQTYPGTSTVVLTKRIGVIADTTVVTYDSTFKRRPVQVTLPQVQDENGNAVKPAIAYTAVERQGYGALRSLDSTYVELKDPRNNWTRSLLNRWGQARKTWDALGVLGRTEYTPEGFALWTEGKVADSSRVYNTYDALRRLARTYIIRAVGDTLRLDSLVYDANHRVIRRIDSRGKIWRTYYDGVGNVIATVRPNIPSNDSTSFWYRSDGLLDSTRLPGNTQTQRFTYDATWKSVAQVKDESGMLLATYSYDGVGRRTLETSKIRVQVTSTTTQWQWRAVDTFYTLANQGDSTRVSRTDNCADPCNDPAFPYADPSDTVRTQRVGHRFDRAGRDSLRLNDRGKAVLYLYDRLGRLVSRRPWSDSMAVKDSFVYDVAGNLKKTITRRGDTLTTNYDSRNRDTLAVIPGVGTRRKTFGGPLDQLTRLWYDTPVDSIGGVNVELRWGYDQRGRLKADTSYTGATARGTSYTYDTYERPSTMTDPLGTWTTRYDATRGFVDTLLTPFADTIRYVRDKAKRPSGPYISNGGPAEQRVLTWNEASGLKTATHTVSTTPSFVAGKFDRVLYPDSTGPALGPVWTEQHGAAAAVDSLRDSLTYDGWERVIAVVTRKNGAVVTRDTFQFTRTGNVRTTAGAEAYDGTTDRLTSRATSGCGATWSYTYDRAGNLVTAVCGTTTWTYQYDALNQLRAVRYNATLIARYSYDVLGRRIAKRVFSSSTGGTVAYTRFVYRAAHVAFETDSAGTISLRYTWGLGTDDLLAIRDAAGNHYYAVQDVLGSVRGVVKRDGTWQASWRYGPYGAVVDSAGSAPVALRYRWTGREYDAETGWYYFRSRYYEPVVRRFVQEDPIGYGGGVNVYAYGAGGPLEGRDPSGLRSSPMEILCGACVLGGGGGGGFHFSSLDEWGDRDPWGQSFNEWNWDTMTKFERNYTGDLQFNSSEERQAYLDLKRQAYVSGNTALQEMLRRAEGTDTRITFELELADTRCIPSCEYERNGQHVIQILRDLVEGPFSTPVQITLAHELGHVVVAPFGVPRWSVPNSNSETEYSAFYYEELARESYGCLPRPWDHARWAACH